jgi:hypothetical protein
MLANWKSATWWNGTQEITLQPGSVVTSVKHLALASKVTEKQIRGCLNYLQKSEMVSIKTANKYTLVVIANWASYQQSETDDGNQNGNQRASTGQSKGNSLRRGRMEKKYFSEPPASNETTITLDGPDEHLAEGDEIYIGPIRILPEDRGSLAAALYRIADQEDLAEAVEAGCTGSVGFGGFADTKTQFQRHLNN